VEEEGEVQGTTHWTLETKRRRNVLLVGPPVMSSGSTRSLWDLQFMIAYQNLHFDWWS